MNASERNEKKGRNQIVDHDQLITTKVLTRCVPYDGYIRHQNDHLSGRMTDISVMSE